jgi:hypothetical protein
VKSKGDSATDAWDSWDGLKSKINQKNGKLRQFFSFLFKKRPFSSSNESHASVAHEFLLLFVYDFNAATFVFLFMGQKCINVYYVCISLVEKVRLEF